MTRLTDTRTAQPRRALVLLESGHSYEALVSIETGRLIHAQNVRRRIGDESYRELGDRIWPVSRLREIRWLEGTQELAAW
jgi:hypothetical protein